MMHLKCHIALYFLLRRRCMSDILFIWSIYHLFPEHSLSATKESWACLSLSLISVSKPFFFPLSKLTHIFQKFISFHHYFTRFCQPRRIIWMRKISVSCLLRIITQNEDLGWWLIAISLIVFKVNEAHISLIFPLCLSCLISAVKTVHTLQFHNRVQLKAFWKCLIIFCQ